MPNERLVSLFQASENLMKFNNELIMFCYHLQHFTMFEKLSNKKTCLQLMYFYKEALLFCKFQFNNNLYTHLIVKMDRTEYTPTKASKLFTASQSYVPTNRQASRLTGQMTIVREFQALKLQARQLQIQNRQLSAEVDKLRYQKSMNQNKLLQKAALEEQAMNQFQKQKSYQLQLLKIKNDQDIGRLKREYQIKIEDSQRQIKSRELQNRELNDKFAYFDNRAHQLRANLQSLELELLKYRDSNSMLTEQVTREQFANKKLEMLAEQLQRQKNQMQAEIHILLDIQAEKSRTISNYEVQLQQSENNISNLHQKLKMLTDNFISLQQHITVMKERLLNAEMRGEEIDRHLQNTELQITEKEQLFMQQKDRELRLRDQIEAHKQRESQRVSQIRQVSSDNQRIYSDLNAIRFKLYDVSIEQGIDI